MRAVLYKVLESVGLASEALLCQSWNGKSDASGSIATSPGKVPGRSRKHRSESGFDVGGMFAQLESRQLLAGVTLVAHGFQGDPGDPENWLPSMVDEIAARIGGATTAMLAVTRVNDVLQTAVSYRGGSLFTSGQNSTGELVLGVDWHTLDASSLNPTQDIATAVADRILNTNSWNFLAISGSIAQLPFHLIGHSRGGSLVASLAQTLGERGLWVDQVTTLDPHPWYVPFSLRDYGYDGLELGSNVVFGDNYFQTGVIPSGNEVATSMRRFFPTLSLPGGYFWPPTDHSDVHLWYHGTIDAVGDASDGTVTLTDSMRDTWYGDGEGRGATTGYYWSRVAGGADRRSQTPARQGLTLQLGGDANRMNTPSQTGSQWPNVMIEVEDRVYTRRVGEYLPVRFHVQDRDSTSTLRFYRDTDSNPLNGGLTEILTSQSLPRTYESWGHQTMLWNTSGTATGTYRLAAKITDAGGRERWYYVSSPVQLLPECQPGTALAGALVGTEWLENSAHGDGDHEFEGGEWGTFRAKLYSSAAITDVEVLLTSSDPAINITDPTAVFDSFGPGNSGWSYGRFDLQVADGRHSNVPFTLHVQYRRNGVSYCQDLTFQRTFRDQNEGGPQLVFADSPGIRWLEGNSSTNNHNGIWESWEELWIDQVRIRNVGDTDAHDVDVWVEIDPRTPEGAISTDSTATNRAATLIPRGGGTVDGSVLFDVDSIRANYSGSVFLRVMSKYDGRTTPDLLGTVELVIAPTAWIRVDPDNWDFGVAAPGETRSVEATVTNYGSGELIVTGLTSTSSAVTWDVSAPFTLPANAGSDSTRSIRLTLDTTGMTDPTAFAATLTVAGGRLRSTRDPGDRQITISGLVSSVPGYSVIAGSTTGSHPDVSGNVVVWEADGDIWRHDLTTGQMLQVTTDGGAISQNTARVSGHWIIFYDGRNNGDVWGADLNGAATPFPVSSTAEYEVPVGIAGDWAFVRRQYHVLPPGEPDAGLILYNLIAVNLATREERNLTGFTANISHQPMRSVESRSDAGGNLVVFETSTLTWTGSSWNQTRSLKSLGVGIWNETTIFDGSVYSVATNNGRVAFSRYHPTGGNYNKVFVWEAGTTTQITTVEDETPVDTFAIGDTHVAYDYDNRPGIYSYSFLRSSESLASVYHPATELRMDARTMVWHGWATGQTGIVVAFLDHFDLRVGPNDIALAPTAPIEGTAVEVTVTVHNERSVACSNDVVVELFNSDPALGGSPIASTTVSGGIAGNAQAVAQLTNVPIGSEGTRRFWARARAVGAAEPAANNTAFIDVTVADADTLPPLVSDVRVDEENGNSNGIISSTERIRVSWLANDASGIGSAVLVLNGESPRTALYQNGRCYVILDPRPIGTYDGFIRVIDGDSGSPLTTETPVSIRVVIEPLTVMLSISPATVAPGQPFTLFATGSGGTGGPRAGVFWIDLLDNGVWNPDRDQALGDFAVAGDGSFTKTLVANTSWPQGVRFCANVLDGSGAWATPARSVSLLIDPLPVVSSLEAVPISTNLVQISARVEDPYYAAGDPIGAVGAVTFFYDRNGNGAWDGAGTDVDLGSGRLVAGNSRDGWWQTTAPLSLFSGQYPKICAAAKDTRNVGDPNLAWGRTRSTVLRGASGDVPNAYTFSVGSASPQVPGKVTEGDQLHFSGSYTAAHGAIEVTIFLDVNQNGLWDWTVDQHIGKVYPVGRPTQGSFDLDWNFSMTDEVRTRLRAFAPSGYGQFAVNIQDASNRGDWSWGRSLANHSKLVLSPRMSDPFGPPRTFTPGQTFDLRFNASDDFGVRTVSAFIDLNNNNALDAGDQVAVVQLRPGGDRRSGIWTVRFTTTNTSLWNSGSYRIFVAGVDFEGAWGQRLAFTVSHT